MEGLQLDGYNSKKKIAFEYQGYQHYSKDSHFHKDMKSYKSQIERDDHKKKLCKKYQITLIEIIEFKTIRSGRIQLFVDQVKVVINDLNLNYTNDPFKLDLIELYRGKKSHLYELAKKIVEKKNGILQEYIGSESKHTFTCPNGHKTSNRTLGVIISTKASCPICEVNSKYGKLKKSIESRGGILIDKKLKSKGFSEVYNWICNKGHKKKSKGQHIVDGYWCSECQKNLKK